MFKFRLERIVLLCESRALTADVILFKSCFTEANNGFRWRVGGDAVRGCCRAGIAFFNQGLRSSQISVMDTKHRTVATTCL